MPQGQVYITRLALAHIRHIGRRTEKERGKAQAHKYLSELRAGLQACADRHKQFPARSHQVGESHLCLNHVRHHYIAFQVLDEGEVAIAGVLHENMDIPNRLMELQAMSRQEIEAIEAEIKKVSRDNQ